MMRSLSRLPLNPNSYNKLLVLYRNHLLLFLLLARVILHRNSKRLVICIILELPTLFLINHNLLDWIAFSHFDRLEVFHTPDFYNCSSNSCFYVFPTNQIDFISIL